LAHLQGRERAAYVQEMFDRIARRYDVMNRLMTFGRDQAWRRYVVKQAAVPRGGSLLDVATGTGDILFEALKKDSTLAGVGADFAAGMMRVGKHRKLGNHITWSQADALALPFAAASFDAVTSGYLMRNVIDVPGAFKEQMRVVKPGGQIVCLDTSPPPHNLLRPFILIHLRYIIPLLGRIVAGDDSAYTYLPESTQAFKTPQELADLMREAGLQNVRFKRFMFGTMAVHTGTRPEGNT
jgi:demethylmenaquinone methyltransferase/2-methoxy-6-polyprenyl-1,4-benzoquinol methylase